MYYVYEWFVVETNEVIYVGKGSGRRYKVRKHNHFFDDFIRRVPCSSRIIMTFDDEESAFNYEFQRVFELKALGQCVCNINVGGSGGTTNWWTDERRKEYSERNVMKSEQQRDRMKSKNPMKDPDVAKRVNAKNKKMICIGTRQYDSLASAAKEFGVGATAVNYWLDRGYAPNHEPCYYYGDPVPEVILNKGAKTGKPVIVDGVKFETVKAAAQYIGTDPSILIKSLKAGKECKGHTCRYDNQQPSRGNSDKSTPEGSTTNG